MSTDVNLRTFCMALAFACVIIVGGNLKPKGRVDRARHIAGLIEEFCLEGDRATAADGRAEENPGMGISELVLRMADVIADRKREGVDLPPRKLVACGFSIDEINKYWSLASALAAVMTKSSDA